MKTIGILGGAGPLAGAALLERLLQLCQSSYGCFKDADFPRIVLISYPFSEMLEPEIDTAILRKELRKCLDELRQNGASVLAIACNTLHAFLEEDDLKEDLVSLPESVARTIEQNLQPLILCTSTAARFNTHSRFFPCVYLDYASQHLLDKTIEEILRGNDEFSVIEQLSLILEKRTESTVVLGCTELSLLKNPLSRLGKRIIDPLDLLAETILKKIFNQKRKKLCQ